MFAITGITGQVGGATADALLTGGAAVRAVVRDAAKAAPWAARGCEVAAAEMDDTAALIGAFAGAEGVFILLPPVFDPAPGFPEAKAVIAAVRQALQAARPARAVVLSTVGAQATQPNLLNQLAMLERELGTLDLPVAFIRAAWFMENAAWDVGPAREGGVIASFLDPLDRPIPMVATADIGRLAAELLQGHWSGKRIIELAGPSVAPAEIAATLGRLIGRPVRAEVLARDAWEGRFRALGMTNPLPRMQMLDGFNAGWIAFEGGPATERAQGATSLETVLGGLVAR